VDRMNTLHTTHTLKRDLLQCQKRPTTHYTHTTHCTLHTRPLLLLLL
jgi:hypothetical protein